MPLQVVMWGRVGVKQKRCAHHAARLWLWKAIHRKDMTTSMESASKCTRTEVHITGILQSVQASFHIQNGAEALLQERRRRYVAAGRQDSQRDWQEYDTMMTETRGPKTSTKSKHMMQETRLIEGWNSSCKECVRKPCRFPALVKD